MGRDMAKKNIADYRWTRENCKVFSVKIRYDSGIPDAIERVRTDGHSNNSYIVTALTEKLIRDGYLPAESQKAKNSQTLDYIPQVVQVVALDDFQIKVYFHDGNIRIFDMKPLLDCGEVFKPLKDPEFFRERLTVLNQTAAWDISGNYDPTKCVDIDPVTIYLDGIKVLE